MLPWSVEEQERKRRQGGTQENDREDVRKLVVAPHIGAGGSHPQAMWVPEGEETQGMRWADCDDDEGKEEEERERETWKETKEETEMASEEPPGSEQIEESNQEAREEEKRSQKAREDDQSKAREEEQRRAQEAPELRRSEREVSVQKEQAEQDTEVEA